MKSLWPESFSESDVQTPKSILDVQGSFLGKITGGIVDAETSELSTFDKNVHGARSTDFAYDFKLVGRFIDNYQFRLFTFWHDIGMYPVNLDIDSPLAKELGLQETFKLRNEQELLSFLEVALKSIRVKTVMSSILSLSK